MPVWVRMYNFLLTNKHHPVLEGIGNTLCKFIKIDLKRVDKGIFTFARICVEMDLSKKLP